MIRIKPQIEYPVSCPACRRALQPQRVVWQGIHICVTAHCDSCVSDFLCDLPVGHACFFPFAIDLKANALLGNNPARQWLGQPFFESVLHPDESATADLTVERFQAKDDIVILNCLDYLYGHALLKLLNAERHLDGSETRGLVVLIPQALRWMVPDGVAEVWTVNVPISRAQSYYTRIDALIQQECARFRSICVSAAHPLPTQYTVSRFTRVAGHTFHETDYRVTYVWREDRPWLDSYLAFRLMKKLGCLRATLPTQRAKVLALFSRLRRTLPSARFTVAGLGRSLPFPSWIDDQRVAHFTPEVEQRLCRVYAESRLIIGVHGSNMLLPSAHAGMTVDLMPEDRWGNLAQDILFQTSFTPAEGHLASWRYRYLPVATPVSSVAAMMTSMVNDFRLSMQYVTDISKVSPDERDPQACSVL